MSEGKWKKVGTVKEITKKDGDTSYVLELDNGNLKEFYETLNEFGKSNLSGADQKELWNDQRKKFAEREFPTYQLSLFTPKSKQGTEIPSWIKFDVCMKS